MPHVAARTRSGRTAGLFALAAATAMVWGASGQPSDLELDPAADGWIRLRLAAARCAVDLPAAPALRESARPTLAGRVRTRSYRSDLGPVELRLEVHEMPPMARWILSDRALLRRAARAMLDSERARDDVAEDRVTNGRPARDVSYRDPAGLVGRVRFVLGEERLFALATLRPETAPADAPERFIASFETW